ncbi:MAG TPA: GNAT family N-acetyltransferase [Acidimicrobiales bacterium]
MIVRRRTKEDLGRCTQLAQEVQSVDGYPPYLQKGELAPFIRSSDAMAVWVAENDGDLIGHVALHARSSDAVMDLASAVADRPPDRFGVVARLFVSPEARGRGVGRILLHTAEAHALGLGLYPILDVVTRFRSAIALYEQCGWTRAGTVTLALPDGSALDEFVYFAPVLLS